MSIPRLDKTERRFPSRDATWPESSSKKDGLFHPRKAYRKLVVMIDDEIYERPVDTSMETPDRHVLLRSQLFNELVDCYRYLFNRKPTDSVLIEQRFVREDEPAYSGCIIAYPERSGFWPVSIASAEKIRAAMIDLTGREINKDQLDERTYPGRTEDGKYSGDIIALESAIQCLEADIYITERPFLLTEKDKFAARGVTVLSPDQAVSFIGLYLRAQQEFIIPTGQEKFTIAYNRGLFYWIGTRELLPEGWRWFSACVYHSSGINDDKLSYLGGATLSRIQRALELRDQVHIAINMETNNDTNDLALTNLDGVLSALMGSIDASARVAHYVVELPQKKFHTAGWQRKEWLKDLKNIEPNLAKIVAEGTKYYHVLRILSVLRNSIHGEPIHAMTKQDSRKTDIIIALPRNKEVEVLESMDAAGGREIWGVKQLTANLNEVDPGVLIDKLFVEVTNLLNLIMNQTPVERLSNISGADLTHGPRSVDASDAFSEWNRVNIKWQLGF